MNIRLSLREKYALFTMVLFLFVFAVVQLIVFPILDEKDRLDRGIRIKTAVLSEMTSLKREHAGMVRQIEQTQERFAAREGGFTLFSFLDDFAGRVGIKDQITYMKPSSVPSRVSNVKISQVEMKIQGVTMNKLLSYLNQIESSDNMVAIERLSITKSERPEGFVNVVLLAVASEPENGN